jgi:hypothetical protein
VILVEPHTNGAAPPGANAALPARISVLVDGGEIALPPSLVCLADPAVLEKTRRRVEETDDSYRDIAADFGVPQATLGAFARKIGWGRPAGAPKATRPPAQAQRHLARSLADAGDVSARILRAIDRQVSKIDVRMRRRGSELEERDARMLAALAKTLQTLIALDRDDGAKPQAPEPVDRGDLNAELARRVTRWAEGRAESE